MAFRALFQSERGSEPLLEVWQGVRDDFTEQTPDESEEAYGDPVGAEGLAFAERLLSAFAANREAVDGQLEATLEGWTFTQMSQTDLTVLRLALTEFLYEPEVPKEVVIEVAIRIAKRYGGEESGRFVNGVLARLYRDLEVDLKNDLEKQTVVPLPDS